MESRGGIPGGGNSPDIPVGGGIILEGGGTNILDGGGSIILGKGS